jgi:transcriptional regulator with XRE-family HTH domain
MNNRMENQIEFGTYIHDLRKSKKYSLKIVADKLGIDISLLSKIESGERNVQGYMLKGISELFNLDYRLLQIKYLSKKLRDEYSAEPYFKDAMVHCMSNLT